VIGNEDGSVVTDDPVAVAVVVVSVVVVAVVLVAIIVVAIIVVAVFVVVVVVNSWSYRVTRSEMDNSDGAWCQRPPNKRKISLKHLPFLLFRLFFRPLR
jgi:fatty acid desaturase